MIIINNKIKIAEKHLQSAHIQCCKKCFETLRNLEIPC